LKHCPQAAKEKTNWVRWPPITLKKTHNSNNIFPFKVDVVVEPKRVFCLPPDMVLIQIAPKNQQLRLYFVQGI
jgi:hypothetical protein